MGIIILAVLGFIFFGGKSEKVSLPQEENQTEATDSAATGEATPSTEAGEGVFSGNIFDLSKRGGDYECTVTMEGEYATNGHVYVSGSDIRGDFSSEVPAMGSVEVSLLANDESVYTWNSFAPNGYVSPRADEEAGQDNAPESGAASLDYGQALSYDCKKWKRDDSVFVLPEGVSFSAFAPAE